MVSGVEKMDVPEDQHLFKNAEAAAARQTAVMQAVNRILQEYFTAGNVGDLGAICLKVAEELTKSAYGFICEAGPDGLLHDIAMSETGWAACSLNDRAGHRRLSLTFKLHGRYEWVFEQGKSLIINDPEAHPFRVGLPQGHAPLEAFLGVPLVHQGKTAGILVLANRPGGYQPQDVQAAEAIAPAIVEVMMRKKAEEAYEQSEYRFKVIAAASPVAFGVVSTPEGRFLFVNPAYEKGLGYLPDELLDQDASVIYWDQAERNRIIQMLKKQDSQAEFEVKLRKKDGTPFWGMCSIRPMIYNGKAALLGAFVDITARKQAEEELIHEKRVRDAILENAGSMLVYLDRDFNFVLANRSYIDSSGHTWQELAGQNHFTFFPDAENEAIFKMARDSGEVVSFHDKPFEFADQPWRGVTFWDWTLVPLKDSEGQVNGLVISMIDTTDRKKAEAELAHLASFPELNPNPIIELDAAGTIYYMNHSAKKLFPDLPAKTIAHPYLTGWSAFVKDIKPEDMVSRARDIMSGDSWYDQAITRIPASLRFRIYGRDITARKRSEEERERLAKEAADRLIELQTVLDKAPFAIWIARDRECRIITGNIIANQLFGVQSGDNISRSALAGEASITYRVVRNGVEMKPDELPAQVAAAMGREVSPYDVDIVFDDDRKLHMLMAAVPLIDSNGQVRGSVAVGTNITELKKAEEDIKKRSIALEAANKEIESFSYSVSHDLRAPLRGIDGFSDALLEDYADVLDEQGKDYLNRIRHSAQQMSQLIDDMLKLSRIGRADMHPEQVNLSEIISSVLDDLKRSAPGRNVEFIIAQDVYAYGDKALLQSLLRNLLENAWKFSKKTARTQIEFGLAHIDGTAAYYVKDNGIGFDMKYADKLFKPFSRLHNQPEYQGTGIGLANVNRIVRRHNGRIWAEGEAGKGAVFFFTLNEVS
jgi:PAS domain S-box-containing protein